MHIALDHTYSYIGGKWVAFIYKWWCVVVELVGGGNNSTWSLFSIWLQVHDLNKNIPEKVGKYTYIGLLLSYIPHRSSRVGTPIINPQNCHWEKNNASFIEFWILKLWIFFSKSLWHFFMAQQMYCVNHTDTQLFLW